ncbi:Protein of unknown function [Desulfofundulus australicus DSM 11792]|uniref:GmrSD restriction endonucleases C-terminal domain-containing protein n=1 Tax=Desulfofundulus australicus DSM 11792 TaxID=1121425 RepID=A0A1M4VPX1_9FIRM|nr:HNH endonuclease family protein [Desulfofundulus australicus]SHE70978.1 Protein of unknown function [Desulfofundulus australicus DSM 11792]
MRRLQLAPPTDDDFFWHCVLSPEPQTRDPETPGQVRLQKARAYFDQKIFQVYGNEGQSLRTFLEDIAEKIVFLTYQVEDNKTAGVVFETTNDRGKPLSELDKIKNYLLYLAARTPDTVAGRDLEAAVGAAWEKILRNLYRIEGYAEDTVDLENSLARYHWIVLTGVYNIYDVYRALKDKHRDEKNRAPNSDEVLRHARDYVENLVEAANLYAGLRKPDLARFGAVRGAAGQYFELLNDPAIGTMANFAPLLMAVFKRFMPGSPEDVCEVLRLCYLFSWRAYRVCNRRSDAGIGTLSSLAHRLWHGQTGLEEITASLKQLIEYYGGDNIFKDNLERNTLSGPERRYFLYRWELHLARQSGQSSLLDWKEARNMQVEHVWPQIPPDSDYGNWRPELKEKHTKIVDLLGNLILLDQSWNASLSNRLPSQKRDEYLNREKIGSNLAMVRELANDEGFEKLATYTSFGAYRTRWMLNDAEKFINARTTRLVEFALQEWKV